MHLDALEHLGTRQDIKQIMIIVGMIRKCTSNHVFYQIFILISC